MKTMTPLIPTPDVGIRRNLSLTLGFSLLLLFTMNTGFALEVGDWVVVSNTYSLGLVVHSTPGGADTGVTEKDGTIGYIVNHSGQPTVAPLGSGSTKFTWWYVEWADGKDTKGWSMEKGLTLTFIQRDSGTISVNSAPVSGSSFSMTGPNNPLTGKAYSYSGTTPFSTSGIQGSYTVTWGKRTGYATPGSQTQSLSANGQITFTGTYTATPTPTPTPTPDPYLHEAEKLTVTGVNPSASSQVVSDAAASGGKVLMVNSTAVGNYVKVIVPQIAIGTYNVRIGVKKAKTYGIFQAAVSEANGSPANLGSTISLYAANTGYGESNLGNWSFKTTGDKTFQFQVTGKSAGSSGYAMCFDYLKLIPHDGASAIWLKLAE